METKTKKIQKLSLKKEIVSSLNNEELNDIKGGWSTSFGDCSHNAICCLESRGDVIDICFTIYF